MSASPCTETNAFAPLCLTETEISELTGKVRATAQVSALRFMGIDHKRRPDGSVVVLRSAVDPASAPKAPVKRTEPNWN